MLKDQGYQYFGQNFEPDPDVAQETCDDNTNCDTVPADGANSKTSLEYGQKKGRDTYLLPIDSEEQDRLDHQHEMCLFLMDGALSRAPVSNPRNVLDVATGTGIWAIQYATANPSSHVRGIDLSAIQRPHSLPNLTFEQHDVEKESWPSGPEYDFIHLRYTISCFDSTPSVIRHCFEHITPGGWIEFFDPSATFIPVDQPLNGTALDNWISLVNKGGISIGRDLTKPRHYAKWLQDAGFVNITEERFGIPCNAWARDKRLKKLGALVMRNEVALVKCLAKFLRLVVEDEREARAIEEGAKGDFRNLNMHFIKDMFIVYAQKPKAA